MILKKFLEIFKKLITEMRLQNTKFFTQKVSIENYYFNQWNSMIIYETKHKTILPYDETYAIFIHIVMPV